MDVIKVEPLTTARALRGPFDYRRPDRVQVGSILEVPFGRQRLKAVVTGLAASSEHALADPLRVLPDSVPAELVELALWMADEYVSTPARALGLVLPPPGRGKTEVYLQLAERVEGGVIVLVPEIALTPQVVARFVERFGDTVAVLHSKLSTGERYDEWRRLRTGEARICVGPRSAVFAPIERPALLIVDEEHDSSYKHEGDPRYDARLVAERRA